MIKFWLPANGYCCVDAHAGYVMMVICEKKNLNYLGNFLQIGMSLKFKCVKRHSSLINLLK